MDDEQTGLAKEHRDDEGSDRDDEGVIIPPVPIAGVMAPAAAAAVAVGMAGDAAGDDSEEARGVRIEQDEPRTDEG